MSYDPVVEEVRRVREQIFAGYNYDLKAMCEDLQRRSEEAVKAGRRVIRAPQRNHSSRQKKAG
ncbi:MAG TPA: hypothetical protein VL992_08760 [Tepidisphaeraceae bacterium]|nr:hypothetical protein [Tepidisphaeraceae bacterium]